MSVILSIGGRRNLDNFICYSFSVSYIEYDALQVGRFRDVEQYGVVLCLASFLENSDAATGVGSGRSQHLQELALADVEGARAGDEDAAGAQHFQRAEVQLFVAAQGGRHGA